MDETVIPLQDGRQIAIREVDAGDMLDVIEAAGHAAGSDAWMSYALTVCAVRSIDGTPVRLPTTKDAMRDLARRLGSDAINSVAARLDQGFSEQEGSVAKN